MAGPIITWHNAAGDVIPDGTPLDLPEASAGTPTTETLVSVRNNDAAAGPVDPAIGYAVTVTGRPSGSGLDPQATGLGFLDTGAVKMRVVSVEGGATAPIIGFRSLGAGRVVELGSIPDGGIVNLAIRTDASLAASLQDVEIFFAGEPRISEAMGPRIYEGFGDFIYDGHTTRSSPDLAFSAVRAIAGVLAAQGPATDTVDLWTSVQYVHRGIELSYDPVPATLQFDNLDGAAVALAAGEAYYAGLSLGAGGLTVTKGLKATAPLQESDKPTLPAGEIAAGWVQVPFGLLIDTTEDVLVEAFFAFNSDGALGGTIGPGAAFVGGFYVPTQTATAVSFPDNAVSNVWVLPAGGLEVVDDGVDPADLHAMKIWTITTAGGVVTIELDRREFGLQVQIGTPIPVIGELYQSSQTGAGGPHVSLPTAGVSAPWTTSTAGFVSGGFVADTVAGTLLVPVDGVYRIQTGGSFQGSNNTGLTGVVAINAVEDPLFFCNALSTNLAESATGGRFVTLTAGDLIETRFKSDTNGTNVTIFYFNMSVVLIQAL